MIDPNMIELVIKIPKELYEDIKEHGLCGYCSDREIVSEAIANSTPLPKGHGRLKDTDELLRKHPDFDAYPFPSTTIDNAPTIIEADTESEG